MGISAALLAALLWWLPTHALLSAMRSIPATIWLLVLTGFVAGHIVSALKWRMMLRATGTDIIVSRVIRAHGAGLFANLCLPSVVGGDVIRAALVVQKQGSSLEAIAMGSLADRINDTLALVLIAGIASLCIPAPEHVAAAHLLGALALMLLLGLVGGIAGVRLISRAQLPALLRASVARVNRALDLLFDAPLTALLGLLLSILIQSSFVGLNVLLAAAVGIDSPAVLWLFAWPMAKLVALAPVSLGGLGVREAALAGLLAPFGVEAGLAVAQSLSWETVLIGSGLIAGILVAMLPIRSPGSEQ